MIYLVEISCGYLGCELYYLSSKEDNLDELIHDYDYVYIDEIRGFVGIDEDEEIQIGYSKEDAVLDDLGQDILEGSILSDDDIEKYRTTLNREKILNNLNG